MSPGPGLPFCGQGNCGVVTGGYVGCCSRGYSFQPDGGGGGVVEVSAKCVVAVVAPGVDVAVAAEAECPPGSCAYFAESGSVRCQGRQHDPGATCRVAAVGIHGPVLLGGPACFQSQWGGYRLAEVICNTTREPAVEMIPFALRIGGPGDQSAGRHGLGGGGRLPLCGIELNLVAGLAGRRDFRGRNQGHDKENRDQSSQKCGQGRRSTSAYGHEGLLVVLLFSREQGARNRAWRLSVTASSVSSESSTVGNTTLESVDFEETTRHRICYLGLFFRLGRQGGGFHTSKRPEQLVFQPLRP